MNIRRFVLILLLFPLVCASAITREVSGNGNIIVKVSGEKKYVLLPIEEGVDNSVVKVTSNGKLKESFTARLAKHNIDYYVPLQVSKGDVLDITSNDNGLKDYCCWYKMTESDKYDTSNRESYRPMYHHTPLYGWMNDPNGMFYDSKNGLWHLYYQYNPYGSKWGNMTWGHSVSNDLIHWQDKGRAINIDALGMIFSGSAVVDTANVSGFGKNAVVAMYTSADRSQMQSISFSNDGGYSFTPYSGNPVLTNANPDFRDPKIFYNEALGKWSMVLACGQQVMFYSSDDLKNWKADSAFGIGQGCHNGVWECPDLVKLNVRGTKEQKWVLIVNVNPGGPFGGSATQYFVGNYDGVKFTSEQKEAKWMDYGKDHYATVSFNGAPDGRTVVLAWMSNWQYAEVTPTKQFRSSNSIACDLELFQDVNGDYFVSVKPSVENDKLIGETLKKWSGVVKAGETCSISPEPSVFSIDLENKSANEVSFVFVNADGDSIKYAYNFKSGEFTAVRQGMKFSPDFGAVMKAEIPNVKGLPASQLQLKLYYDNSSMEVFEVNGRIAMTNLVFPKSPYSIVRFVTDKGSVKVKLNQSRINYE